MVNGQLLNKDGRLKMSGHSNTVTRHLDPSLIVPGILKNKIFNPLKFKRGMTHSWVNKEHVLILEMIDRQYLATFAFYYYRFGHKDFKYYKTFYFPGQYPKISDNFSYWKGEYQFETSAFKINIKDQEVEENYVRTYDLKVFKLEVEGTVTVTKPKSQKGAFHTYPLWEDKRYWARTYCQMNMDVIGQFKIGDNIININSDNTKG